jgi:hypothetical protein
MQFPICTPMYLLTSPVKDAASTKFLEAKEANNPFGSKVG